MNKVILIGNMASDPDARTTPNDVHWCSFRLAVQRRYAGADGKREADFLTVVCWRATADFCAKYLKTGRKIAVEGSIQTRSYDAQDGTKRYVVEIIADSVEALGGSRRAEDPGPEEPGGRPGEFAEVDDDELPF